MKERAASINRETKETSISLSLALDSAKTAGRAIAVDTGFGMADHMLTLLAFWAGFDLQLKCRGDMVIDAHHTVEDVALCFGQAIDKALGDRAGISRTAQAKVPMDEAIADVAIDLSGRPFLVFRGAELLPAIIAGEERDLWREFFKSFANAARMNLHIDFLYGENGHHLIESAFKGLGLAMRQAVEITRTTILSTKGSLD